MSRRYNKGLSTRPIIIRWPHIEGDYTDEFGRIVPEVYEAAGTLWHQAQGYALMMLRDEAKGQRLLLKATAIVSRVHEEQDTQIADLRGYLFQTFKHLVFGELAKEHRRMLRLAEMGECLKLNCDSDFIDHINTKILIEQIEKRMDSWTHDVFRLLVLDHTFEEIGRQRGKSGHVVRTKFRKQIIRIMKKIKAETDASKGKSSAYSATH
jgi:hypothetical protein